MLRTTFLGGFSNLFGGTGVAAAVTSNFNGSATFKDFNPRASISWQPNADHNLYFTYSQGFKGGGFDPRGQTDRLPQPARRRLHRGRGVRLPAPSIPKRSTATKWAGRPRCSTTA